MKKTQVRVYFSLFGDEFPIDEVTDRLGIIPTLTYKKGELINRSNDYTRDFPLYRKETVWDLDTSYQDSYDVKEQMDQILIPLKNKTVILNQLKVDYKLECKISIVIIMENGDTPGLYLDNEQIEFANSVKAEFDIDLYANPYEDDIND
ncbi:DUF4279 domain-containing protein [Peribacillus butanolivorans]|uniref:DUF4279 domain-containing protein n=1 Tax=Peribacillus butanolivorans TaxID=421767 RepID=UPI002E1B731C|nr:DUF4279 domain-containing protein [Peribacillus butanolivorans]